MTYRYDDDVDYEPIPELRRRAPWSSIIVVAGLAAIGVASAFLWRGYGGNLPALLSFSSGKASPADTAEKIPGLAELQTLQQQSAAQMQTALQLLNAQQAELKTLSNQILVLEGKVDTLQKSVTAAQPVAPPPAPIFTAPPVRKKPVTLNPKPARAPPPAPNPIAPPPPNRP